jgi:serine protease Do
MRGRPVPPHTQIMQEATQFSLEQYSAALEHAVENAGAFVAAVKSAPHRVTSGVIFAEDLIAVNSHVLRKEAAISVLLPDGSKAEGRLLGRDPSVDVAILQVTGARLTSATSEEAAELRAGALALVVGRTVDCGLSASTGILGAVGGPRRTWRSGQLEHFLRLDVNLYPSQAGAAVVSARGRLIGMASPAMLRHSALAIPRQTLDRIAAELLKAGRIRQGYLGVGLQPVALPEHLQSKSPLAGASGLMVLNIEAGSSAALAGLQLGDILLAAGTVSLTEPAVLHNLLRGELLEKPLRFTLLRGGDILELEIQVAVRP